MKRARVSLLPVLTVGLVSLILSLSSAHAWAPPTGPKLSKAELKKKLNPIQYKVVVEDGTEAPFKNEFNDLKEEGIFVDVVYGEPLFSSLDKYDSGTGWPSFSKPIAKENVTEREDNTLFTRRTEVRSRFGDLHLGHVFDDGPKPTGLRYCMNSASMRFIPRSKLKAEGYAEFEKLFDKKAAASGLKGSSAVPPQIKTAIFAGGCFWCMEPPYDRLQDRGVISTTSGYSGGTTENPTYDLINRGDTGHYEVVEVKYDASKITFKELLEVYFRNIDPYDSKGQFCDKGDTYRPAVFYANESEKKDYESVKTKLFSEKKLTGQIAVKALPAAKFYAAEDYHQDYYLKNPIRYKYYRYSCGRDQRLKEVWGTEAGGQMVLTAR